MMRFGRRSVSIQRGGQVPPDPEVLLGVDTLVDSSRGEVAG
jgi:hypothetical protein